MASSTTTVRSLEEGFRQAAEEKSFSPLWTVLDKMVPPHPNPRAVPSTWRYDEMRPNLMKAGEIIDAEAAERRVLMLVNKSLGIVPWEY